MQICWLLTPLQRRKGSPTVNELQIGPQMTPTVNDPRWGPHVTILASWCERNYGKYNSRGHRDAGGHGGCLDAINPTASPRFRSHQEIKIAARRTQRSKSTISRKYKGFWTVQLNRVQFSRLHIRSYPRFQILFKGSFRGFWLIARNQNQNISASQGTLVIDFECEKQDILTDIGL